MSGAKLTLIILTNIFLIGILFIVSLSMQSVAEEIGIEYNNGFKYDARSEINKYDTAEGEYNLNVNLANVLQALPTDQQADVDQDGNFFTDTFKSIKSFLLGATGVKYILNTLNTIPSFISSMFPGEMKAIGFALGYMWYAITIFSLIFWIKGGGE